MDFALTDEQQRIREAVAKLCERFDDDYWLKRDSEGGFPADFHQALAKDGWLGVAMPVVETVTTPSISSGPKPAFSIAEDAASTNSCSEAFR